MPRGRGELARGSPLFPRAIGLDPRRAANAALPIDRAGRGVGASGGRLDLAPTMGFVSIAGRDFERDDDGPDWSQSSTFVAQNNPAQTIPISPQSLPASRRATRSGGEQRVWVRSKAGPTDLVSLAPTAA